jgi:CPA2 family monovalent cation:H+ antiporter-2
VHDLPLLVNVAAALAYAVLGGLLAQRLRLPPIVGYLLAGVAIGPFTPGFVGDTKTIAQLAELGVVFLMFGVGLHFSLRDLWLVRHIAIPGALIQMTLATALGYALARAWDWSSTSALLLGLACSVASTVVLLRGLMDHGLLETAHGKVAVGWLVFEDIATVLLLVFLPLMAAGGTSGGLRTTALAVGKALLFVALMLLVGKRLVPWMLDRVVRARSREIFVVVAFTLTVGTALASAAWFGVSLALGAFLAGVVVGESRYSHQVGGRPSLPRGVLGPLLRLGGDAREPGVPGRALARGVGLSLVIGGKACIAAATGFFFPWPARTALVVAAGLSQIGEFSFIVGQAGLSLGILDPSQVLLILAGARIHHREPFMFRLIRPAGARCSGGRGCGGFSTIRARPNPSAMRDHVVIVGAGRVGGHLAEVLQRLEVPHLVVEANAEIVERLAAQGVPTLYGDAGNSDILQHAHLKDARAVVVTVPDETTAAIVVVSARHQAPAIPIVVRVGTPDGARELLAVGASEIVQPELEGGIQILRRTLRRSGTPCARSTSTPTPSAARS